MGASLRGLATDLLKSWRWVDVDSLSFTSIYDDNKLSSSAIGRAVCAAESYQKQLWNREVTPSPPLSSFPSAAQGSGALQAIAVGR